MELALAAAGLAVAQKQADHLYPESGRQVIDVSGMEGTFDVVLDWTPAGLNADALQSEFPPPGRVLEEQLGLRLEGRRAGVEYLVVDRVERPAAN